MRTRPPLRGASSSTGLRRPLPVAFGCSEKPSPLLFLGRTWDTSIGSPYDKMRCEATRRDNAVDDNQ